MIGEQVDLALFDTGEFFDVTFTEEGDFKTTDGLDTSLIVSFFTDKRADTSEVNNPRYQRGWWGTLFNTPTEPELGSKIWLLDQSVNTQDTLNNAITYSQEAYNWVVELGFADEVQVTGTSNFDTINIIVKIIKNNNIIDEKVYNLWQNTVNNIVGSNG